MCNTDQTKWCVGERKITDTPPQTMQKPLRLAGASVEVEVVPIGVLCKPQVLHLHAQPHSAQGRRS